MNPSAAWILDAGRMHELLALLRADGRELIGPTVRDGAIVYDAIERVTDLPRGWTDVQRPAGYALRRRDDDAFFGFSLGPQSWKRWLHAPLQSLFRGRSSDGDWTLEPVAADETPRALIGVRACELQAIAIQDRVLMGGAYVDPHYAARRRSVLVVAVQCAQAGQTCFCSSMNSGPRVSVGYDLNLTERIESDRHYFVVEVASEAGHALVHTLELPAAEDADRELAETVPMRTAATMPRQLDLSDVRELLYQNLEHAQWDSVAARCTSCGNCTMVCPTCFCTSVEDTTSLLDEGSTGRVRRWDSCFAADHSYLHGGNVRAGTRSRYRQWVVHKMASWHDQFGTAGCVGCGRCVTWCPVGIDMTAEIAAIRATPARHRILHEKEAPSP